jgi:hypothetical protein
VYPEYSRRFLALNPLFTNKRLRHLSEGLATMAVRVRQVVKQAKARVFEGVTQLPGRCEPV